MTDPVAPISRAAATRLAANAGPALTADVEAVLAHHGSVQSPQRYLDPTALGSLVVSVAALAWTIYTDLRSKTQSPSRDVLARTIRVRLDTTNTIDTTTHDRVIEIVVDETIHFGQNPANGQTTTHPPSQSP